MNKIIIVAIIVVVALTGLFIITPLGGNVGTFMQSALAPSGNVWCDNFEWYCCQEVTSTKTDAVSYALYGACSTTASKCVITNVQSGSSSSYVYFGSQNCRIVKDISTLWSSVYRCDNTVTTPVSNGATNIEVPKGYVYWAGNPASFTVVSYSSRLAFTGASAEAVAGIPVSGSSNCVWNTALKNPNTGAGIGSPYQGTSNPLSLSYTVPVNDCTLSKAGTQFLCGNIFDECDSDSDCKGYPINGNQVCSGGVLQTYRCLPKGGLPVGVTQVSDGKYVGQPTVGGTDSNRYSGTGKVCTVDQTLNRPVSCCPSSSVCGSNAFCDPVSFTCKDTIECSVTSDCNTAPSCDYVNLVYKTPKCSSLGKCGYSSKAVECCAPANCNVNQDCDLITHTCKDKTVVKDLCPFSCCVGDALYVDRVCPSSQFCVNHECTISPECSDSKPCSSGESCESGVCKPVTPETCNSSFLGLVERHIGVKEDCNFWCKIGLKSPEKINVCVTNYTPLVLAIVFILGLTAILVFGLRKNGGKGRKKSGTNFFENKIFWKLVALVVVVVLLLLYFKFIVWIALGLLVIFILDAIFLRGIIRKVVFW